MARLLSVLILLSLPAAAAPVVGVNIDPAMMRGTASGLSIGVDAGAFLWWGPLGLNAQYRLPYSSTSGAWEEERANFTNAAAKAIDPNKDGGWELGGSLGFLFASDRSLPTEFDTTWTTETRTERRTIGGQEVEVKVTERVPHSTPKSWEYQDGVGSAGVRGGLYHWTAGLDLMDVLGEKDVVKTATGTYGMLSRAYLNTDTNAAYAGLYYANFYKTGLHNTLNIYADLMFETSTSFGPVVTASGVDPGVTEMPWHRSMGWRAGMQMLASPLFHMKAEGGYRPGYAGGYVQLNFGWGFMTL